MQAHATNTKDSHETHMAGASEHTATQYVATGTFAKVITAKITSSVKTLGFLHFWNPFSAALHIVL